MNVDKQQEIFRLIKQIAKLKKTNKAIIAIAGNLKNSTINKILEMDDTELGLKSLLGLDT